ncbi:uncharacterized protein LOC114383776 [Glycine soja]|uniref:uncharacterized mitochondrial protein AtMg00240-like n=1 Tax=Glycine max TaxID=3847 RepID=UPI0003DEC9FF|nr:uncharacterized mitochondrial protein AtMg00240-like [Glycine max]XP_028199321.1 uncharacterized protein LOC114383776 [Glycine soja]|eukprot:XP_006596633.1 uncharacterized protein LOC102659783 [Glycine max]
MDLGLQLDATASEVLEDPTQFRRLLGRLMYLIISRPDIIFPINRLSQFMQAPRTPHLQAFHQVLQYLKAAPAQGLFFSANNNSIVTAYVDSDWGNCKDTRRSTTGFVSTWAHLSSVGSKKSNPLLQGPQQRLSIEL